MLEIERLVASAFGRVFDLDIRDAAGAAVAAAAIVTR
jgi:hypothetical protein